jgi:hypothetical protein
MIGMRSAVAAAGLCLASGVVWAADGGTVLTPLPDLSITVPKGWKACDDASEATLGNADDPLKLKPQICDPHKGNADFKFGAFSPALGKTVSVLVYRSATAPITAEVINGLTDDVIAQIKDQLKKETAENIAKMGSKLDDYAVRKDTLSGQPALVSTVLQTPKMGAIAQVYTETWEIPFGGGYYRISFVWPKIIEASVKPELDTVRASIKLTAP